MPTALRSDRQRIAKLEKLVWLLGFSQCMFAATLLILYIIR